MKPSVAGSTPAVLSNECSHFRLKTANRAAYAAVGLPSRRERVRVNLDVQRSEGLFTHALSSWSSGIGSLPRSLLQCWCARRLLAGLSLPPAERGTTWSNVM